MQLELRWLKSFVATAEELSFSRAARRIHLAQPALTAQIQKLEEAVGASLFDRTNRIQGLTQAGLALLPEARSVLARVEALPATAERAGRGESGRLRLGLIPPAAVRSVAEALRVFATRYPAVALSVRQAGQARLMELLAQGELDLVIGRSAAKAPGGNLRECSLMREEQGIVLREDDPLALGGKAVALSALRGRVLLLLRDNPSFGQNILGFAARERIELRAQHAAEDFPSLHWMVRAGLGFAPCSLLLADTLPRGLVARPLRPGPPKLTICALWRAPRTIATAENLLQCLRTTTA